MPRLDSIPSTASPLRLPLLLAALLPFACGCSLSPWKRELVYSASGVALFREYQLKEGQPLPLGYKHPVQVTPEKMAVILSRVEYEDRSLLRKPRQEFAFRPEYVAAAAEAMSVCLGGISPDERLRFLVTRKDWMASLRGVLATSGVMFSTEEGVLNIAFDKIKEGIAGAEEGDPKNVTFPYEPTELRGVSPILPMPGSKHHADPATGESYPRWLEVELAKVERIPAPPQPSQAAPVSAPAGVSLHSTAATSTPGASPPSPPTPEEELRYQRVRARVELLKRLRADGTLSEVEYTQELEKALSETR